MVSGKDPHLRLAIATKTRLSSQWRTSLRLPRDADRGTSTPGFARVFRRQSAMMTVRRRSSARKKLRRDLDLALPNRRTTPWIILSLRWLEDFGLDSPSPRVRGISKEVLSRDRTRMCTRPTKHLLSRFRRTARFTLWCTLRSTSLMC
ncbi:hypothetical protein L596_028342 [Steinernema carpocapsae]|uniref:Uncharacterized protein n=1 Tax=Steinernema carpocapsae TaxID=34508 RepID=A0A4U5LY51_STECR|nr:hypothetical protein L596_028342 [Steinernema carpocapsae]